MLKKLTLVSVATLAVASAYAQTTWTGAANTDWSDDGNWDAGAPSSTGDATFDGTVTANLPDIGAVSSIRYLNIETGGWTFNSTSGTGDLQFRPVTGNDAPNELNITGDGLTIFNANLTAPLAYNGPDMFVDDGSKLVVNGNVVNPTGRSWQVRGDGYFVFNGAVPTGSDFTPRGDGGVFGSYIYNSPGAVVVGGTNGFTGGLTISSGNILGGSTPTMQVFQYITVQMGAGSTFTVGGDGATIAIDGYDGGAVISAMTLESASSTIRAGINFDPAATLRMDLGASAGISDQITLGSFSSDFSINGATLALFGDTLASGDYTLLTETVVGSDYTGTFGTITYNGAAADPEIFSLTYNPDSIVLSVAVVPEPSTYAGLMGLAIFGYMMMRRRRRA